MPNELRVRQNFVGGLAEDNPLTAAATTLTSAALSVVPVIGSTQHYPVVLDPDGIAGEPEIVYITAHTAAATTATILRAQEGTTAREHLRDTNWIHGPTARDVFDAGHPPLARRTLHPTYGDHFTGTLNAKWTRVGYVIGNETYATGEGTFMSLSSRPAGNYHYQASPSGDFEIFFGGIVTLAAASMYGAMIVDATGFGVFAGWYNATPDGPIVGTLGAGATYDSANFVSATGPTGTQAMAGNYEVFIRLKKVGTNYTGAVSGNGILYNAYSVNVPRTFTPARVGFGCVLGTASSVHADYFNLES